MKTARIETLVTSDQRGRLNVVLASYRGRVVLRIAGDMALDYLVGRAVQWLAGPGGFTHATINGKDRRRVVTEKRSAAAAAPRLFHVGASAPDDESGFTDRYYKVVS